MSMRQIYRQIAKENGVTVEEVRREMQAALDEAYRNPANDGITKANQGRVSRRGEVPTPEEFIRYAARELRRQGKTRT